MASINKAIIVGNLGNEPDTRYMANGTAVTHISIATSEFWQDKQTGQKQERTEWHRVVFFGRLAEIVKQYLHKGSQIYVEGNLRTEKWQDQNGIERYTTKIVAREMQMLGSRSNASTGYVAPSGGGNYPPYAQPNTPSNYPASPPANQGTGQPTSPPPYNHQDMGESSSLPPYSNEDTGQPFSPSPSRTGPTSTPPPPDKDFDQDVPF